MTGTKAMVLLLLVVVPILGACRGVAAADELPVSGVEVTDVRLIGSQVYQSSGKWLGEVAGVVFKSDTGALDYLVLSYQEPWVYGRGLMATNPQRFVPIPWARFTPGPKEGTLSLDADEMTLIPAPYLERAPVSLNAAQALAIDDYW